MMDDNTNIDCHDLPEIKLKIGDCIKLSIGKIGIIKYIGNAEFTKEKIIGLELLSSYVNGSNGIINNKKIYDVQNGYGYILRQSCIKNIIQSTIKNGCYAQLKGLRKVPQFNGKIVKVISIIPNRIPTRWKAKLLPKKKVENYQE